MALVCEAVVLVCGAVALACGAVVLVCGLNGNLPNSSLVLKVNIMGKFLATLLFLILN